MTKSICLLLTALLLGISTMAHAAEQQLEVISLQHRMAAELLPTLEPFVDKQGVISARDNQLIIRTSSRNLEELKGLIKQLDKAARRLLIEVKQPLSSDRHGQQGDISGTVTLPEKSADVRLRVYGTGSRDTASAEQQIQVLEGHTALIKTGQLMPLAKQRIHGDGRVETVIEHQDVSSGFRVTPRLSGDTVLLEIMPFSASPASSGGGIINRQQVFTTVSTRLGEWVEIGGISSSSQQTGSGIVYKTHERNEQQRQILIRVTEQ